MTENKKQHFVPKFYLKYFSCNNDNKSICICVLDKQKYISHGNLGNQAYKDNFYGKNKIIENAFSEIENHTSGILNQITFHKQLPRRETKEHLILKLFIVSLALRTERSADQSNEMIDKVIKQIYSEHPVIKGDINQFTIGINNASLFALHALESCFFVLLDLNYKILINNTNVKFISSDNPVIRYNPFLTRKDPNRSHLGFATKGLVIFFPVSPEICLIFYDEKVYSIGYRKRLDVIVNPNDVNEINKFQYIYANRVLYFNEKTTEPYICKLLNDCFKYRPKNKVMVKEYPQPITAPNSRQSILHVYPSIVRYNLNVSFLKIIKNANKYDLGNSLVHARNPEDLDLLEQERNIK